MQVWVDARIISVERKPHETGCSCQFYVKYYVDSGPLGSEKGNLSKESVPYELDHIRILQRLDKDPVEDQYYRWSYAEDCTSLQKTKLFLGKFSADLSWLLVASVLRQTEFEVKSIQNKIVYQILGCEEDNDNDDGQGGSSSSDNHINAMNFKSEDDILTSKVIRFDPKETVEALPACDELDTETLTYYEAIDLRRSKRRNVQPERFLASDVVAESSTNWVRQWPIRTERIDEDEEDHEDEDDDMHLPISYLRYNKTGSLKEINQISLQNVRENINELAIVPVSNESEPLVACYDHDSQKNPGNGSDGESSEKYLIASSAIVQKSTTKPERPELKKKRRGRPPKSFKKPRLYEEEPKKSTAPEVEFTEYEQKWGIGGSSSGSGSSSKKKEKSKMKFDLEDDMWFHNNSWGKPSNKRGPQLNKFRPLSMRRNEHGVKVNYRKSSLSAGAYNRLINSYMRNIDNSASREENPSVIDQWNQFKESKTKTPSEMKIVVDEDSSSEDEEEVTEMDMLWKEMDFSLASAYIMEHHEVYLKRILVIWQFYVSVFGFWYIV